MKLDEKILNKQVNAVMEDHIVMEDKLSNFLGDGWTALYHFPEINSRVCSSEVKVVRDLIIRFKSNDIRVLGMSFDDINTIELFAKDNDINHTLISDSSKEIAASINKYDIDESRFVALISPEKEITFFSMSEKHVPRNFNAIISEIKVQMIVNRGIKVECNTRKKYE